MARHVRNATIMIGGAVWVLCALLSVQTAVSAADDLYNYSAGDESRTRTEDIAPVEEGLDSAADQVPAGPDESAKTAGEEAESEAQPPPEVTVERLAEGEWKIIKPNKNPAGIIKVREGGGYYIYDTHGLNMGVIDESGLWMPRDAARKTTLVGPAEVRLYLYALDALKKIGAAE